MRSMGVGLVIAAMQVGHAMTPSCAQQPTESRTLEDLVNADDGQKLPAAPQAGTSDAGSTRPAGTVVRPSDGVKHPDLDKAWAAYEIVVAKAAEGIRAAIAKQFDEATEKGDLDAAEKWQMALDKFQTVGEVPSETVVKPAVSAAAADYRRAKDNLTKSYESLVKALTMEKKIAEAKAVRDESRAVSKVTGTGDSRKETVVFLSDLLTCPHEWNQFLSPG